MTVLPLMLNNIISTAKMTGVEVLIGIAAGSAACGLANTMHNFGTFDQIGRWFRFGFGSYNCTSISRDQNQMMFYHITEQIHKHHKNFGHKTVVTFSYGGASKIFYVQECNEEIEISTKHGVFWIKAVSLDKYNIFAYELLCHKSEKIVDNFIGDIVKLIKPDNIKDFDEKKSAPAMPAKT